MLGIKTVEYGSNIDTIYNGVSPTTIKFQSLTNVNTSGVTADANRIRIHYDSMDFLSITVGANGSGAAYFFLNFASGISWTSPPGAKLPLPVELISFSAKKIDNTAVKINWATASEINNSHFEVERSIDGRIFTKIGEVNSKVINGFSSMILNYSTFDMEVSKLGVSKIFYRIKQVDYDGKFEYSNIIAVKNSDDNPQEIVLFPNVSSGTVQFNNHEIVTNSEVYNSLGGLVYSSKISNPKAEIFLDLPIGMYYYFLKNQDELVGKGKLMIKQ